MTDVSRFASIAQELPVFNVHEDFLTALQRPDDRDAGAMVDGEPPVDSFVIHPHGGADSRVGGGR